MPIGPALGRGRRGGLAQTRGMARSRGCCAAGAGCASRSTRRWRTPVVVAVAVGAIAEEGGADATFHARLGTPPSVVRAGRHESGPGEVRDGRLFVDGSRSVSVCLLLSVTGASLMQVPGATLSSGSPQLRSLGWWIWGDADPLDSVPLITNPSRQELAGLLAMRRRFIVVEACRVIFPAGGRSHRSRLFPLAPRADLSTEEPIVTTLSVWPNTRTPRLALQSSGRESLAWYAMRSFMGRRSLTGASARKLPHWVTGTIAGILQPALVHFVEPR